MKKYLLLILLVILLLAFKNDKKQLTIKDALAKNMISYKLKGLGGYSGECMNITIKNNSNIDTTFYFESGRKLISKDKSIQDILIIKPMEFLLASGKEINFKGFGFCCQAHNGAPYKDSEYEIGNLKNIKLASLANYLHLNKYKEDQMQNAIWVVSDNNPISSIFVPTDDKKDEEKMMKLKLYVAKLMDISTKHLWYSLKYKTDTIELFTGDAVFLNGKFDFRIMHYSQGFIAVFNDRNQIIKYLSKAQSFSSRVYTYPVHLNVNGWKKGKYFVRVYSNNRMQIEKEFEL